MPELPEVQAVVDTLAPVLTNARIARVVLRRRDVASEQRFTRPKPGVEPSGPDLPKLLEGRTISAITRRAKRIQFQFDNDTGMYIHLGMSGRITLMKADEPSPAHTHFVMGFGRPALEMRFSDPRRFGKIVYLPTLMDDPDLGPEPLTLKVAALHAALKGANRPLKPMLLDQTVIAGLGNIYVDESLHASKLHPLRKARSLSMSEATMLLRNIQSILKKAIKAKGSTLRDYRDANGEPGAFQTLHKVYDRKGQPCPHCKHPIERIVVGGRSTHLCPRCQKR